MSNYYDDPEELKKMLEMSDRDLTMQFFYNMELILKNGGIPPQHWLVTATELLFNAAKVRTTNHKNPLADALCITNVSKNGKRNSLYGTIVGFYMAKANERDDNTGIGWAIEHAREVIKSETGSDIKTQTLKDIFDKDKKRFTDYGKKCIDEPELLSFILDSYFKPKY